MCIKPARAAVVYIASAGQNTMTHLSLPASQHAGWARVTLLRLALGVALLTGLAWLVFRLWLSQLTLG